MLGIMIRKSNDPEHLDGYTDADWSGGLDQPKEHLGWSTQGRVINIARIHEGSELSDVIERRKRVLRCGDDDSRGIAPPTSPGILGHAGEATIANRYNASTRQRQGCGPLKHIETRLLRL